MRRRRRRWGRGLRRRQPRGWRRLRRQLHRHRGGNGVRTGSEACDDGNTIDGDCCSASCVVEAAGGPCAGDGNGCTDDVCDGAGFCGLANVAPCDDGSPCTGPDVCGGGACDGTSLCTACERCNEAVGCVAAPSGCARWWSRKSTLAFSRDRLTWRAAELAVDAPHLADDHTLCMFDESGPAPRLLFTAHARGTTACDSDRQSCWRVPTRQHGPFVYRDATVMPDGLTEIRLFPDPAEGRVSVKVETPLSGLPLSFPLRVQLLTKHGCAEASYEAATSSATTRAVFGRRCAGADAAATPWRRQSRTSGRGRSR